MNIKSLYLLLAIILLNTAGFASVKWGATGHRVVGAIADQYTTKKAKRQINKILNHKSLALVSTFADEIKSDPRFKKYESWHYVNMAFDEKYETSTKNPKGDLVTGIAYCKRIIKDNTSSDADKAFYLKMLIHLVGDMHQPLHVGRAEDRGGNDIKVKWQSKSTNLHRVWDSQLIDSYKMSYSELAENAAYLTKNEIKSLQEGSVVDWVNANQQMAQVVYASVEEVQNLQYGYSYKYLNVARSQMQIGGIRLAQVLNELFQ